MIHEQRAAAAGRYEATGSPCRIQSTRLKLVRALDDLKIVGPIGQVTRHCLAHRPALLCAPQCCTAAVTAAALDPEPRRRARDEADLTCAAAATHAGRHTMNAAARALYEYIDRVYSMLICSPRRRAGRARASVATHIHSILDKCRAAGIALERVPYTV